MKFKLSRPLIVIMAIVILSTGAQARSVSKSYLDHLERMLKTASLPPTDPNWPGLPRTALRQSMDAFQAIITKYGPNGQIYMDMANAARQQGNYEAAMRLIEQALPLLKQPSVAQSALDDSRLLMQISEAASGHLPKGQTVLRVMSLPASGQHNSWVVLSANQQVKSEQYPTYRNVMLTLFRGTAQSLDKVWQSDKLGYPGYTNGEFNDLQLYLVDLNRDGIPEAVIPESLIGADWVPSFIDIFAWRAGRLTSILATNSEFPVRIQDLNHDGTYEVMAFHSIGWNLPRAARPLWADIYAYKNGAYKLSDEQFPDQYKDEVGQIKTALKGYPNDFQLHQYLGMTYQILGNKKEALAEYQTALSLGRSQLGKEDNPQRSAQLQRALDDIQQRINALTQ